MPTPDEAALDQAASDEAVSELSAAAEAAGALPAAPQAARALPAAALQTASGGGDARERITLHWRPFRFPLPGPLRTAAGALVQRRGWLLRLETAQGAVGWGEAAPLAFGDALDGALEGCAPALRDLHVPWAREDLEQQLPGLPPPLAFALGAALAEADGLVGEAAGGWRPAPPSAWLLPAGEDGLVAARAVLESRPTPATPLTLKWKVGVYGEREERAWYGQLTALLPPDTRLRLDANGGFSRATAWRWADQLRGEGRLEWLEQPLDPADQAGLEALAERLPIALDESLLRNPELRRHWPGWQVRRPSQEGDPRLLLRALAEGQPRWMVSTSFESGIGRRWLAHLAALRAEGPTPVAPGLAPGWRAPGGLGSEVPEAVWQAAGEWGAPAVPRTA